MAKKLENQNLEILNVREDMKKDLWAKTATNYIKSIF